MRKYLDFDDFCADTIATRMDSIRWQLTSRTQFVESPYKNGVKTDTIHRVEDAPELTLEEYNDNFAAFWGAAG